MRRTIFILFILCMSTSLWGLDEKSLTWLQSTSHAGSPCIRIDGETVIYIDPARLTAYPGEPDADLILITHPHGEHCNAEAVERLLKPGGKVVTCEPVFEELSWEMEKEDFIIMEIGEMITQGRIKIEAVASYELDNPVHKREDRYTGFILTLDNTTLYYSGDVGYMEEFELFPPIDYAIISLRVENPFLLYPYVFEFINTVQPRNVIPVHWLPKEEKAIRKRMGQVLPPTKVIWLEREQLEP